MNRNFTQLAFTDSVKQVQREQGSRKSYERMETSGDRYELTSRETEFIATRDSFYLSTVGENGWPYLQFRGGPPGFLQVLDEQTLGMADFRGNRQYISAGNINATGRAALFLIDYPTRSRLKIWAQAEVRELAAAAELAQKLAAAGGEAVVERLLVFRIQAYDWNCQQHITPRFSRAEIAAGLPELLS